MISQQEKTCCLASCRPKRERGRELTCLDPYPVKLDDFDPTIVLIKAKPWKTMTNLRCKKEDGLTSLDYPCEMANATSKTRRRTGVF